MWILKVYSGHSGNSGSALARSDSFWIPFWVVFGTHPRAVVFDPKTDPKTGPPFEIDPWTLPEWVLDGLCLI